MTVLIVFFSFTTTLYADQLIIEPEMGRKPIENAINHAQQSLNLVMYGFTDKQLLDAFIQQKNHGRTVKIILERSPYKAQDENNKTIHALNLNHVDWQGIVSPFRLIHQKTLLVDGREAIIMTFNFTRSTFKKQRNFALIIDDPKKVKEIAAIFSADWNHKTAINHQHDLIYSPDDSRKKLIELIANAKHSIKIYAQSISDYKIVGALAKAAREGKEVTLLTSSSLRTKQINYLAKAGVKFFHSEHYYIHAKVFILDNQKAVIGSINLTRASLDDNRELSVVTQDPSVIKQLNATFEHDCADSSSTVKLPRIEQGFNKIPVALPRFIRKMQKALSF